MNYPTRDPLVEENLEPLNLLTADEFFPICKHLRPLLTREEFDQMWQAFQHDKAMRKLQ